MVETLRMIRCSSRPSSWTLHNAIRDEDDGNADAQEWDPHDDGYNTLSIEDTRIQFVSQYLDSILIDRLSSRGVAYHLKSYKLQDLGNVYPKVDILIPGGVTWMKNASMYIPCGLERRMKKFPRCSCFLFMRKRKEKGNYENVCNSIKKTQ